MRDQIKSFYQTLQDNICEGLLNLEPIANFRESNWTPSHSEATKGGGRSRILEGGQTFEKGAVHFSEVHGTLPESMAQKFGVSPQKYFATGTSLIIHPKNPYIPTVHANYRYFELESNDFWFGGGTDLTPYYPFEEDCKYFHGIYKIICDNHDPEYYPRFKTWCDEYFSLPHRGEMRGIGGIFFDYLKGDKQKLFSFVQDAGNSFLESYIPIAEKRRSMSFGERELWWQSIRRGRYVEFNLLYDRGTKFGLESGGRTESILSSLPPLARWEYEYTPQADSAEAKALSFYQPHAWV